MSKGEPATTVGDPRETEVGSVFVSNYPPYSFWSADRVPEARRVLDTAPGADVDLGLYVHVPFCRKRCKFCYFKVYTEKNAREIERYVEALAREVRLLAATPAVADRPLKFVYVGGGTPSFLASKHLRELFGCLQSTLRWDAPEEVTFECEPGTLTESKVATIRELGVTRLSLGVENFDDTILQENGRAHLSKEIGRCLPWIRAQGFDQLNIDLISGMVGETWDTWRETVERAIELGPDSVTIYQMELPYNTVYSRQRSDGTAVPVADWETKRAWHDHAIERLAGAGYEVSSAYTMVRSGTRARFVYRDSVWHGCDLLGTGVSSFSHVGGVHYQNLSGWGPYLDSVEAGALPIERGFATADRERLTRETILQLKLGRIDPAYFQRKFGKNILEEYAGAFERLRERGMLEPGTDELRLTRQGLLRVDSLLPEFYAPQYRDARYT